MARAHRKLEDDEMVRILEDIARKGGDTARIAAIKTLREMRNNEPQAGDKFAELYPDEVAKRRETKKPAKRKAKSA